MYDVKSSELKEVGPNKDKEGNKEGKIHKSSIVQGDIEGHIFRANFHNVNF